MLENLFSLPADEIEALLKLQIIVMSDPQPSTIKGILLVTESSDNQTSVIDKVVDLYHQHKHPRYPFIVFGDIKNPPSPGCSPARQIMTGLERGRVSLNHVSPVNFRENNRPINTYTELTGLVDFMARNNVRGNIYIVASPFHQLRSIISAWSAQEQSTNPLAKKFRFFSVPGQEMSWKQKAIHSQGILTGVRHEFVLSELDKIAKYHLKGDLISPKRALEIYLDQH